MSVSRSNPDEQSIPSTRWSIQWNRSPVSATHRSHKDRRRRPRIRCGNQEAEIRRADRLPRPLLPISVILVSVIPDANNSKTDASTARRQGRHLCSRHSERHRLHDNHFGRAHQNEPAHDCEHDGAPTARSTHQSGRQPMQCGGSRDARWDSRRKQRNRVSRDFV